MENNSLYSADESCEEEYLTGSQLLYQLEKAWLNEKFSPELLPHKAEIVEIVTDLMYKMRQNFEGTKKNHFKVGICKMELERVQYVLSSYMRTRLRKIENFTLQILEKEKAHSNLLTKEELEFAKQFQSSIETHFKNLALGHMPHNLQALDTKQIMVHPNLDSYVFLRVDEDVAGVVVDEETDDSREDVVDFTAGDQHLMCYRPVASLINSGKVSLI